MLLLLLLGLLLLLKLCLLLLLVLLTHRHHRSHSAVQAESRLGSRGRVGLGLLGRGRHRLLAHVQVGMGQVGSQRQRGKHGGGRSRMKRLMLHGRSCRGGCRIVQGRSRVVVVMLQLVLIGCSLLACLLLTGRRLDLRLWLDRRSRNLGLVIAGRSRVKRHRQHLLKAHARDSPRDIPRTWMVLHCY